ncbi:MAG: hypothetical protein HC794_05465, partial [Nitrospiraceae bacterium]|nr:hypothetical protein [Nitrospiraceae bacterium]
MSSWVCWVPALLGAGLIGWGLQGMRFRPWAAEKKQEIVRLSEELVVLRKSQVPVQTIEKRVEVPVEKIVEKPVERQVDNPAHVARIKVLESEVAIIGGLREQIAKLEARPPEIVEKVVEKRIEVPVEKLVEKSCTETNQAGPKHLKRLQRTMSGRLLNATRMISKEYLVSALCWSDFSMSRACSASIRLQNGLRPTSRSLSGN